MHFAQLRLTGKAIDYVFVTQSGWQSGGITDGSEKQWVETFTTQKGKERWLRVKRSEWRTE